MNARCAGVLRRRAAQARCAGALSPCHSTIRHTSKPATSATSSTVRLNSSGWKSSLEYVNARQKQHTHMDWSKDRRRRVVGRIGEGGAHMSCGRYIVSEGVRTPFPLPAASVRSVTFSFRSGFTCCLAGEMIFWLCRRVLNKNEPTRAREGTGGCRKSVRRP